MESYQRVFDILALRNLQMRFEHWLLTEVLVRSTLVQLVGALAALWVAMAVSRPLEAAVARRLAPLGAGRPLARSAAQAAAAAAPPAVALALVFAEMAAARLLGLPDQLLSKVASLLVAWIVIRLLSGVIRSAFWARAAAALAFAVAALDILDLLSPAIVSLDRIGFRLGAIRLSALDLLRGTVQLAVLLWIALAVSRLLEERVQRSREMAPSLRVLTGKLLRFSLIALALLAALASVGIDVTAFAVFTGALGVALGFGMQKSVSNLISGLLLLFDRSIKPGDVLELSDPNDRSIQLFGWVTALNARYVSLTTRDGTEWLIPNDELVSRRIVNWSYTHNRLRLLTPIGVSFECDVRLAMELAVEAARRTPRVLADPPPVCRLMGFGDSSANLEMRFWIDDPTNGIINVRSDVLLAVWELFREHGIRTPLGHRDLFIKEDSALTVRLDRGPEGRVAG